MIGDNSSNFYSLDQTKRQDKMIEEFDVNYRLCPFVTNEEDLKRIRKRVTK